MNETKARINDLPLEERKRCTDEYVLLGVLSYAKNRNYNFQRMQIMKILQKLKERIQEELKIEAYHQEFCKGKHGDLDLNVYKYLTNLKRADFITSNGCEPYEKFVVTDRGQEVFSNTKMSRGEDNEKLEMIKEFIEKLVNAEGHKSSEKLREENHARKIVIDDVEKSIDEIPNDTITTPNLKDGDEFVFDNRSAIDWSLHGKIASRKRDEVLPEGELPETQKELYEMLRL